MRRNRSFSILLVLAWGLASAYAQSGNRQPESREQHPDRPAAPAFETTPSTDDLPLSAVDTPTLEPVGSTRSTLTPAFEIIQGLDSNPSNLSRVSSVHGLTRVLGSFALHKEWRRQNLDMSYVGGGSWSTVESIGTTQEHELGVIERIGWRSGQLALRDFFSYLPEGTFGNGSFGGSGSLIGIGGGGLGGTIPGISNGLLSSGQFGSLGQQPRISNVVAMDVVQDVSPRSSFTLAGSYGLVHFMVDGSDSINSQQFSEQVGYNYQLNRRDQIGMTYAFQVFHYPAPISTTLVTHVANFLYGHRISERLDFRIAAGPQATGIEDLQGRTRWMISGNGQASLRVRFPRTSFALEFQRYNTSGSGIVAGAISNVVRFVATRPFGRKWNSTTDFGYARNSSLAPSDSVTGSQQYSFWYAGAGLRRQVGRHFGVFASYQYNQQLFDASLCVANPGCNQAAGRHNASLGLDWHPSAVRLD